MKTILHIGALLALALFLVVMPGAASAQLLVDFNSTGDLAYNFNSSANNWTNAAGGGIGGSGAVAMGAYEPDLYTFNSGIPTAGVGTVYNVSAFFFNGNNSGYGGLGFSTSVINDVQGRGYSATGLGMATHAGGGLFANDLTETPVNYSGDQLADGKWYKIIFTITAKGGNAFDLEYQIWTSDPNGLTGSMITDEKLVDVVNADFGAAETIYPYFSAVDDRMYEVDNFAVGNTPLPIQLASLTAAPAGGSSVTLVWKTASETNNYGFYVERSADKKAGFGAVSSLIPGHGTSTTGFSYEYADKGVPAGNQYYRLKQVDLDNAVHYSDAVMLSTTGVAESAPIVFVLSQNYPNPFNPSTQFRFSVAKTGFTTLVIYNAIGQEVSRIFSGVTESGKFYTARLDGTGLASGVYFARLQSGIESQMKKIVLMK